MKLATWHWFCIYWLWNCCRSGWKSSNLIQRKEEYRKRRKKIYFVFYNFCCREFKMLNHSATLPEWPHLHCLLRRKNWTCTYNSPFEDVLGYLDGRWRVPLYGVRVWLLSRLCDDHLDRSVTIWEKVKRKKHLDVELKKPDKRWRLTHGRLIWQYSPKREGAKTGYFGWACWSHSSFGLQPKPLPECAEPFQILTYYSVWHNTTVQYFSLNI